MRPLPSPQIRTRRCEKSSASARTAGRLRKESPMPFAKKATGRRALRGCGCRYPRPCMDVVEQLYDVRAPDGGIVEAAGARVAVRDVAAPADPLVDAVI